MDAKTHSYRPTRKSYVIGLDVSRDLYEASLVNTEASQLAFTRAYKKAARQLAAAKHIEITVEPTSYDGPYDGTHTDADAIELWQAIHDCVELPDICDPWTQETTN